MADTWSISSVCGFGSGVGFEEIAACGQPGSATQHQTSRAFQHLGCWL